MVPEERPSTQAPATTMSTPKAAADPIGGAVGDITIAVLAITIPMSVLSIVFGALVAHYRLPSSMGYAGSLLSSVDIYDHGAYYVDYSATRLITVSSWTSTVTSLVSSFATALLIYPLARTYMQNSQTTKIEGLLSPYQLRLLIGLSDGSLGSLWSWFLYCFWKRRSKQPPVLQLSAASSFLVAILGYSIFAADTWLHVTTSTVPYDKVQTILTPASSFSRGLAPICFENDVNGAAGPPNPCTNGGGDFDYELLQGGSEAYRTLTNASSINAALPVRLHNRQFAYLADVGANSELDFEATTFAVGTTCEPISQACNLHQIFYCSGACSLGSAVQEVEGLPYHCSKTLYGDLVNGTGTPWTTGSALVGNIGFFTQYFAHPNYVKTLSSPSLSLPGQSNSFYFAAGAIVATTDSLFNDPEAVHDHEQNKSALLLSCQTTVHNLQYKYINGTFTTGELTPANVSIADNIIWPFFKTNEYAINILESSFMRAAQLSNTSQQLAEIYAQSYSETALSMIAGIMSPRLNLAEQSRQPLLVARLPKAPFFTLLALNSSYVLMGFMLAIIAYTGQPKRVRSVQARLSIAGLVAALVENGANPHSSSTSANGIEGLFGEYSGINGLRVAIIRDEQGRWTFEKVEVADSKEDHFGDEAEDQLNDNTLSLSSPVSEEDRGSLSSTHPDDTIRTISNHSAENTNSDENEATAVNSTVERRFADQAVSPPTKEVSFARHE